MNRCVFFCRSFATPSPPTFLCTCLTYLLKSALSGLRQFLATENLLNMMKNAFDLT